MISLNNREKKLLMLLAGLVLILLVYYGIISPIMSYKTSIAEESRLNHTRMGQLDLLKEQYDAISEKMDRIDRLLKNRSGIATIIDRCAAEANIITNKAYSKDSSTKVGTQYKKVITDIKFENVDIKSMMSFIYKLENSGVLVDVSYIRIHKALKQGETYDVNLKINSYSIF